MKKVIRYLAKQSGVWEEAYRHGRKDQGFDLKEFGYWFNDNPDIKRVLVETGIRIGNLGYIPDKRRLRDEFTNS
jgi:hypothetical protein